MEVRERVRKPKNNRSVDDYNCNSNSSKSYEKEEGYYEDDNRSYTQQRESGLVV